MKTANVYLGSFSSNALTMVIGIATSILVNRFLSPIDRGELASVMFIAATASGFVFAFVSSQALIRHLSQEGETFSGVASALAVTVIQVLAVVPAVVVLMATIHQAAGTPIVVAGCLAVVAGAGQVLYNGLCSIHRAKMNFQTVALMVVIVPAGFLVGLVVIVWFGALNVVTALLANTLPVLACTGLLLWLLREGRRIHLRWSMVNMLSCLRQGRDFFPVAILGLTLASADRALILVFGSLETLGNFAAAASVTVPLIIAAEAIVQISFVEVSKRGNLWAAREVAMTRFRLGQVVLLGLGAGLMLIGPWFVETAFGRAYADAASALRWLVVATVVRGLMSLLDSSLRAIGELRWSLVSAIVGACAMTFGAFLLIRNGGATGAAQAVLIGYAASLVVQFAVWRAVIGANWREFWGVNATTLLQILRPVARVMGISLK